MDVPGEGWTVVGGPVSRARLQSSDFILSVRLSRGGLGEGEATPRLSGLSRTGKSHCRG